MKNLKRIPRIYTSERLAAGASVLLDQAQARYVAKVMRLKRGDHVRLFNSEDGEWLMAISDISPRTVSAVCTKKLADAETLPDIDYLFAPLKSGRLDYMVQKATEMGARRLCPVITERTVVRKVKLARIEANVREAAEQCNMVCKPDVLDVRSFESLISDWDPSRHLIFCDEDEDLSDPIEALRGVPHGPVAVLIGPEGGFSSSEQHLLRGLPYVTPISLGPRVMRADTAAVAALSVVQAVLGDWCADQDA